jgi:hypothetical protein
MANPSTVWTQLSIPNPPAGGVPYVDLDNATIKTDVLNFRFIDENKTPTAGTTEAPGQLVVDGGISVCYTDSTALPGSAVMNKVAGRVTIPVGIQSVTVSGNSYVFPTSIVQLQLETIDPTLIRVTVTNRLTGQFTITGNAISTGLVNVSFLVTNTF